MFYLITVCLHYCGIFQIVLLTPILVQQLHTSGLICFTDLSIVIPSVPKVFRASTLPLGYGPNTLTYIGWIHPTCLALLYIDPCTGPQLQVEQILLQF